MQTEVEEAINTTGLEAKKKELTEKVETTLRELSDLGVDATIVLAQKELNIAGAFTNAKDTVTTLGLVKILELNHK